MGTYVLDFHEIDQTKIMLVGGKGANLGKLANLDGIRVPEGFCISTQAFQQVMAATPLLRELLDQLSQLTVADQAEISHLSREIRAHIESTTIPPAIRTEITRHLSRLGPENAYAVRSSATAEDLPTASFAGQQDTYLNVMGEAAILRHISEGWASLFTARAITYRLQNGIDHRQVHLAVVVQKMVFPQAAGILFTADPVTGNRRVLSIDASFGLGEALVSGLVNADNYQVRGDEIAEKQIATKTLAIHALPDGGTQEVAIAPARQHQQALTDAQIVQLARLGSQIEEHFGSPQDIEWCLADDTFYIVQSRPITTLFPIPAVEDEATHVYISVGHQQMMTDPLKPLGLSFFLMTTRAPMRKAGGRLFVDVTQMLAAPASRETLLTNMGQHDPLMKDALLTLLARGDFGASPPRDGQAPQPMPPKPAFSAAEIQAQAPDDPSVVAEMIARSQAAIQTLKQEIQTKSGTDLFDFIVADIQELRKTLFDPQIMAVIMAAMHAATWLNEKMAAWLGEKNVADTLAQSVPNNITSQMGLALLDVADVIRPYPEVVDVLQHARDDRFLAELAQVVGGEQAHAAIQAYLEQYGMRGVGEIDITRTRWREKPSTLVPMILSNIKNFAPHAGKQKFAQGQQEALQKEQALLAQLQQLPDGAQKANDAQAMIRLVRNFSGYREYPKYGMVHRYFVYKQALLQEAEKLVHANVLQAKEECYYLTFEELREVVRTQQVDEQIIRQRQADYAHYAKLTPPRVITSDGEIIVGAYQRDHLPAAALVGLPVSAGVIEGRARVIFKMEDADLAAGDILVTPFTDPSWTPLFVAIKGLVTEVGGLMTHGAVIAREYGLPAVVGVEHATTRIKDGQQIRVHGTEGYVEIL